MSINTRVEAATASMESSAAATAADTVRIGRFANEPTGYTATGGGYVPSLREKLVQWESEVDQLMLGHGGGNIIHNTANGYAAMLYNTTGSYNTANGYQALYYNTTGGNNTANGYAALYSNTTGGNNTANGYQALYSNTTGSGNTAISPLNSNGGYAPVFNPTTENNRFCLGHTGITNLYSQVALTVVSDLRDKTNIKDCPHGLEFIRQLRPVAYQYREARDTDTPNGGQRYGFIAQEVLAVEGENPVIVDNEDPEKLRMVDQHLIAVLVKAVQELTFEFEEYRKTHP